MAKEYRIHIRGKQREVIDADLMVRLVVMLGRQLARETDEPVADAQAVEDGAADSAHQGDHVPRQAAGGRP